MASFFDIRKDTRKLFSGLHIEKYKEICGKWQNQWPPEENAAITLSILEGEKGPRRDAVVLNSGAALYIAGKAESMEAGVRMAEDIISSGRAKKKLEEFIACSNS